jgi:ribonuclease HII
MKRDELKHLIRSVPNSREEQSLVQLGYHYIAGVDEAGRGALAGPVVAAAVIMPTALKSPWLKQVRDSKLLTPRQRETLCQKGVVSHEVIDGQDILIATRLAMKAAVTALSPSPQWLLIDYLKLPEINLPQKGITHGDALCLSIACASIVAKVARDRIMVELDTIYTGYDLAQHKGYGTAAHLACLRRLGASPIHRLTFKPVRGCQGTNET